MAKEGSPIRVITVPSGESSASDKIYYALMGASSNETLAEQLVRSSFTLKDLGDFARDPRNINQYFRAWASEPERFAYQLGVIGSYGLSASFREELGIPTIKAVQPKIRLFDPEWTLCEAAEPRMKKSLGSGSIVVWQGAVAIKFTGKETGLVFRTVSFQDGSTLFAGTFVSPRNGSFLRELRSNMDNGIPRSSFGTPELVLMRAVDCPPPGVQNLVDCAREFERSLPDAFGGTIDGFFRRDYRIKNFEYHHKR